jgi:glycine/D-amino acid oxidase-like deaminating enzyme
MTHVIIGAGVIGGTLALYPRRRLVSRVVG